LHSGVSRNNQAAPQASNPNRGNTMSNTKTIRKSSLKVRTALKAGGLGLQNHSRSCAA